MRTKEFHEGKIEAFRLVLSWITMADEPYGELEDFLVDAVEVQEQVIEDELYGVDEFDY